jgi:hypothetical protein
LSFARLRDTGGIIQKEIRKALDFADEKPQGAVFVIPAKLEPCEVPESN